MIRRILILSLTLAALLSISPAGEPASAPALDPAIEAFVRSYFESWSKSDFARYRACFHSTATINFRAGDAWLPWELQRFLDDQEHSQAERRSQEVPLAINLKARYDDVAFVEVQWRLQRAPRSDFATGVDWFTLVKTGTQWQILHLTFWQNAPEKPRKTGAVTTDGAIHAKQKIVVSGFDGFGGRSINASAELAKAIKEEFPQLDITFVQVPVVWGAPMRSVASVRELKPDVWIAFGEGTRSFQIETVARNRRGEHRDNSDKLPSEPEIVSGGPEELTLKESTGPLNEEIQKQGLQCKVSANAGSYLCEEMLYTLLKEKSNPQSTLKHVLFVHVPTYGAMTRIAGDEVAFSGDNVKTAARDLFQAIAASLQLNDSK